MGNFKENPWLGLESYQESQIIYGRNQEIEELSLCILNNNETVLYGKSGIGKSSIINAGIIPILRENGYIPIVLRLDHNNTHSYLKQISDLIEKNVSVSETTVDKPIEEQRFWEYFHSRKFGNSLDGKSKLVIIFDQFEEIFTLQNNPVAKIQFFKELADVLNNVMPKELAEDLHSEDRNVSKIETSAKEAVSGFADMADFFAELALNVNNSASKYNEDNDIHFVFTLREDFLSEFEYHTTKIPSLKQHRYGLRPLNEEQAADIIMKPRPELVDIGVARLIIETITNRTDFTLGDEPEIDVDAAVLSLFLNQIYDKRDSDDSPISIDLVKTFGKDIIKDFYEEAIDELTDSQIDFLEEELLTGENRRDSLSRSDFKAGGFSDSDLKRLIDDKKILRQFHYGGDLRVEFIHDILCPVVKERREQRKLILEQESERKRQEKEKEELLKQRDRERTLRNIEYNRKKRAAERNVLIHKGRRLIDNAYDFGEFRTINSIPLRNPVDKIMVFVRLMTRAYEDYYENLSESDFVNQQVFCDPLLDNAGIVLSFYKDDESVPTIDGVYGIELKYEGALISDILFKGKRVLSDGSTSFDEPIYILGGYCGIHIDYDDKQREIQRTYLDDAYKPIITMDGYSVIQTEYDEKDNPIKVRYYSLENGKLSPVRHLHGNHGYNSVFDKTGNEIERFFVDENEQPTKITSGVYGKRMTYETDSFRLLTISNIDYKGDLMADTDGYVTDCMGYDDQGFPTLDYYLDENGQPWKTPSGIYGSLDKIDFVNNIITMCNIDEHGSLTEDSDGVQKIVVKINEKRQISELISLDKNDNIIESEDKTAIQQWSFDGQNRLRSFKFLNKDRLFVSGKSFDYNKEGTHIIREYYLSENGVGKNESFEVEGIEYSFDGDENLPVLQIFINENKQYKTCNDGYHAVRTWEDDKERIVKQLYYDVDGTPMPSNAGVFGLKVEFIDEKTTKRINLDAVGNMMEDNNGVAYSIETETSSGTILISYNINGEPHADDDWVYVHQEKEDIGHGYRIRFFVLNASNEPIQIYRPHKANAEWGSVPCVVEETTYDDKGRPLAEYFKDAFGELVGDSDGYCYTIWEYDDSINQEILSLYSILGQLRVRIKIIRDSKNRIVEQSYINENNEYFELERGYSGELYEYDYDRNTKTITFINSKGDICNNKNVGYARRVSWRDQFGRIVAQMDLTADDIKQGKDSICNFVEFGKKEGSYYLFQKDSNGKVITSTNGAVYNYFEEDNKGRTIKNLYLDSDKLPLSDADGDYGLSYEYDDEKGLTIMKCLDESGRPHNNKLGYGIIHSYTNDKGQVIKQMYFAVEGIPVPLTSLLGCYGSSYEYPNEHNRIVGYLNENGEITENSHGYAYKEECLNPETGVKRVFYYDKDRNNTQSMEDETKKFGFAIAEDENWRRIFSLGKDGNVGNNACGYAVKHELYEDGVLRFYKYLDVNDRPIADNVGDFGTEIQRSDDGSMIRLVSLNEKYERHLNDYGYCFCDVITDITGDKFQIWRDMDNNQVLPKLRLAKKIKNWLPKLKSDRSQTALFNCRQIGAIFDCVLGNIEADGHGKKQGLHNTYVLIQYDNWHFGDESEKLGKIIESSAKQSKHLVLLPVTLNGSLLKRVGNIIECKFPAGQIGMRFKEWGINIDTIRTILEKKEIWDQSNTAQ